MLKISKGNPPDLEYKEAVKKPIKVRCVRMDEEFEVETMEGKLKGKKGDWLMIGVRGEMYPCDNEIFMETYNIID